VCKVFLVVPTGVNGHAEVRLIQKLDFEDVNRNGWLVGQLPFLALSVLQPIWRLEGGTHFGILQKSGTKQEFLERRLW
jgi:hypothetical protein